MDLEFRKINNQFRIKKLMPSLSRRSFFTKADAWCLVPVILFLCLNLSAGTRIAIVSENGSKLPDLLTAELSDADGIELLDRSEIRKVLKEHKISAQMLDSKQTLKLNKLLKTDLFVVIESEKKGRKPIGLVVFDANTGVRYWDSVLPEGDIEKVANFATDAVKKALGKRQKALGGKLKYISLLGVRNVDLPRDKDPLCKAVGILLMRQLGNSSDIVILERNYLDYVTKERNLGIDKFVKQLKSSNIILDLEVAKRKALGTGHEALGKEDVECGVFMGNKRVLNVVGDLGKPEKLANQLAAKFAEKIKIKPLGNVDFNTSMEAKRFYCEAKLLHHHKKYLPALEKMEAACALDPDNYELCQALSFYLADAATVLVMPDYEGINIDYQFVRKISVKPETLYQALILINRSLDYKLNLLESISKIKDPNKRKAKIENLFGLRKMKLFFQEISQATEGHNEKTAELLKECQRKALLCFKAQFDMYKSTLEDVRFFSSSANEAFTTIISLGSEWQAQVEKKGDPKLIKQTQDCINKALKDAREYAPWPVKKSDIKLLNDYYFAKASLSPRVEMQLEAELAALLEKIKEPGLSIEKASDMICEFKKYAMEKIASLPSDTPKDQIVNCYLTTSKSDNKIPYEIRRENYVKLFRFMEKRKDFVQDIAIGAVQYCTPFPKYHEDAVDLIKDSHALLKDPETRILQYRKEHFKENITGLEKYIYSKNKDLIPKDKQITPWIEEKQLFAVNNKDSIYRISCPVVQKNKLFFVIGGVDPDKEEPYVRSVSISLPDGKVKFGSRAALNWETHNFYTVGKSRHFNSSMANAACVSQGNYYLGTCNNGIYVFHENGKVEIINKEKDLPSNKVQSLAVLNNKLYAGLGDQDKDSYLISYDLKDENYKLLASSQRKEKESPFDDSKPTRFPWMMADPEKDRIILFALKGRREKPTGLWSINIKDDKMQQLFHSISSCEYVNLSENNNLIISDSFGTFTYNLNDGKTRLLNSFLKYSPLPGVSFKKSGAGNFRDIGPKILLDDWLWSADFFARISPDRKTQQVFNFHDGEDLFKPKEFMQSVTIDDNLYILASSQQYLWMFKMGDEEGIKEKAVGIRH